MTPLEFVASLVDSLAWPVVVIIALLLLRDPISKAITAISALRYKDLEIDFQAEVEALESKVEQLPESSAEEAQPTEIQVQLQRSLEDQIEDVAAQSPAASILIAWAAIEIALTSVTIRLLGESGQSPFDNFRRLRDAGYLSENQFEMFNMMRNIRNNVAHGLPPRDLNAQTAINYGQVAMKGVRILRQL